MKNIKWLHLVLIVLLLAAFFCYRGWRAKITDTTAPKITISQELFEISVEDPDEMLLQGVTATDDRDGDVTDLVMVENVILTDGSGRFNITYAAFDRSGNVSKAQREGVFVDYVAPRFGLTRPLAFVQNTVFDVFSIVTVDDMVDGDISYRLRATMLDAGGLASLGVHNVEFRATNSMGDTAKLVLPVEVYAAGLYQAQVSLTDYLVYLPAGADFTPEDYLLEYKLNNQITSLEDGLPENFTVELEGTVDTNTPGVYAVSYTVSYHSTNGADSENSVAHSGYTKLIVVVEG